MTGGMAYEALNNIGHSEPARHHRPQRQRPQLRADDLQPHRRPRPTRDRPLDGRSPQPAGAHHRASCRTASPTSASTRCTCAASARLEQLPARPAVRRPAGREGRRGVQGRRARVPAAAVVLRGARRPLRRPGRRPRHRGARDDVPQRDRAVGRGPDRRPRADPEGPRLPAGRGRRREAPPRRAGVRSGRRPAAGRAHRLHAGVRRGDHQGGRGRSAGGRHHRGDGRPDRAAPVPGPLPRPVLRRRHRRAARRHRRRRHGDGRAASGRRDLLARSSTGRGTRSSTTSRCTACRWCSASTAPASPAPTAPATTACTTWRCCPRCPACACWPRRARRSCRSMLHDALQLADEGPVAIRYPRGTAPQVGEHEVGVGLRARRLRQGDGTVCILAIGKMVVRRREGGRRSWPTPGVDVTVWDVRSCAPLDPAMIADAARHGVVVTCEDGIRDGGIGMTIADQVHAIAPRRAASRCSASRASSSRRARPTASWPRSGSTPTASSPPSGHCSEPRRGHGNGSTTRRHHRQRERRCRVERRARARAAAGRRRRRDHAARATTSARSASTGRPTAPR